MTLYRGKHRAPGAPNRNRPPWMWVVGVAAVATVGVTVARCDSTPPAHGWQSVTSTAPAVVAVDYAVRVILAVTDLDDENRVQEDDPSWDCATMGNRQCGDTVNI